MIGLSASIDDSVPIFWAEPLTGTAEAGAEDPLALDYLGQRIGNEIFPRFTTRTNRAWYYAVVLYGLDLVDRAIKVYDLPGSDETRVRLFERWERFWAMATVASREGRMVRGDPDAMRGIEGAKRHWARFGHRASFPIDPPEYHLISRQIELGGLGAYLSSLRSCGLVLPKGSLRVGAAAHDIVKGFWGTSASSEYDSYAMTVLDPRRATVDRKPGRLTIEGVGRASRLTTIREAERMDTRHLLHDLLITANARHASGRLDDTTAPLARLIERAVKAGWSGDSREWFEGALGSSWGRVEDHLPPALQGCLDFGDMARSLMAAFNALYGRCMDGAKQIDYGEALESVIKAHIRELLSCAKRLLSSPAVRWLRSYEVHASGFLDLVTVCSSGDAEAVLDALLRYHAKVQVVRGRGGGWMILTGDAVLILDTGYTGYWKDVGFPDLKVSTVTSLLADLGRIDR